MDTRGRLAEAFYFGPSPIVSRVIFFGTPHRGSPVANRPIGQLGALLVDEPSATKARHQQLIRDNPGVFSREFSRRIPTSIDLLRPRSPLLHAMDQLPFAKHVRLHSIIGYHRWMIGAGSSDGTVPISSARHLGVNSEKIVRAAHGKIHRSNEGIHELFRILRNHVREFDGYDNHGASN